MSIKYVYNRRKLYYVKSKDKTNNKQICIYIIRYN